MIIIGADYHPSFQTIAFLIEETGEYEERELNHSDGEAERFYRELHKRGMRVRVGMEATGFSRWFERLLAELDFELWIGDPAEIAAQRVKKRKTDREDARLLLKLMREDRFPQIWIPSPENRDLRQLLWHRHRLVQMRTRIMNQLQALAMNAKPASARTTRTVCFSGNNAKASFKNSTTPREVPQLPLRSQPCKRKMRFGQHRHQRMMRRPAMLARVGSAQRPFLVTVALEHRGIQIQAVARGAFRQSFELPVPQAREKTLTLALPEALEQIANCVVDRKTGNPQQRVQGGVGPQQTGVREAPRSRTASQ